MKVNWDPEESDGLKPGIYLAEVLDAVEKFSRAGNPYVKVTLGAVEWGKKRLCVDNIMLDGKGRSMGQAKLKALGIGPDDGELPASSLIGRRVYAACTEEEYMGRMKLVVNISQGEYCGFWREDTDDPPETAKPPDDFGPGDNPFDGESSGEEVAADDTPF